MVYRKEIDGLRALAVLAVIFYHANFSFGHGGFIGVDIFFVISGFLITSILVSENAAGTFSIVNFYERRARRILPALFALIFVALPFAWFWLIPNDLKQFSLSLMAVAGFVSNILFYSSSGYFDTAADWKPLLHTWSLAVEEQFYLFFPLLLAVLLRFSRRTVIAILGVITAASLAYAHVSVQHYPEAAFYLLPARLWELMIGALIAFKQAHTTHEQTTARSHHLGSALGLGLIVYALCTFTKHTPHPSLYTLIPTFGAALIIMFANHATLVGKLLSTKLLVGIGLISYSVYLWHWPLFVFAKHKTIPNIPSQQLIVVLVLASLALGYLSWRFIEAPFRQKNKFSRRAIFLLAGAGTLIITLLGAAGYYTNGFAQRLATPANTTAPEIEFPWRMNGWCFYQPDTGAFPVGEKAFDCWLGDKTAPRKALLFGDSYAGNYEPFWDHIGKKSQLAINSVTTNWCVPTRTEEWTGGGPIYQQQCQLNRKFFVENISQYNAVILGANWMDYFAINKFDQVLDLIDFAAAKAGLVVIMAAPTAYDINPVDAYQKAMMNKLPFDIAAITTQRDAAEAQANQLLREHAKKYTNVLFISRADLFAIDGQRSEVTRENIPFSFDGGHISTYGSKAAAQEFLQTQTYKDFIVMLQKE